MIFLADTLVKMTAQELATCYINDDWPDGDPKMIKGASRRVDNMVGRMNDEMYRAGNILAGKDNVISFIIDMVSNNTPVTIEYFGEKGSDDLEKKCIVLASLLSYLVNRTSMLRTPRFMCELGAKYYTNNTLNLSRSSLLLFGDRSYRVSESSKAFDFYKEKIKAVCMSYEDKNLHIAKSFDKSYDGMEFNLIEPEFTGGKVFNE